MKRLVSAFESESLLDRVFLPGVFVAAFLLAFSRRPDALLNAQFFAEDGAWWYSQAHDMGLLEALITPYRNYLHLAPRLTAVVSLAVPLTFAPLVMNVVALAIQSMVATFIASMRLAEAAPSRVARLSMALLVVGLPNIWGTLANVTNSQWHLAVLACAVVVATTDARWPWRTFDVAVLVLSGLSGPFALFLAPVAFLAWLIRRERWTIVLASIASTTAVIQLGFILLASPQAGAPPALGASTDAFLRVVVGRVVYGLFLGQTGYERIFASGGGVWFSPFVLWTVGIALAALLVYAAVRGPVAIRLVIIYAALAFTAALVWPSNEPLPTTFWQNLTAPGASNRYVLLPMLAVAATLVWLACTGHVFQRAIGGVLLAIVVVFGVVRDWREAPLKDYEFATFVEKYDRTPSGSKVQILYPPGWSMVLTKP